MVALSDSQAKFDVFCSVNIGISLMQCLLIQEFTTMLCERQGERLDEWLRRVDQQGVAELQSFMLTHPQII